ncbi:uncharacterized protein LOC144265372 [Eretmochelys imbricata]
MGQGRVTALRRGRRTARAGRSQDPSSFSGGCGLAPIRRPVRVLGPAPHRRSQRGRRAGQPRAWSQCALKLCFCPSHVCLPPRCINIVWRKILTPSSWLSSGQGLVCRCHGPGSILVFLLLSFLRSSEGMRAKYKQCNKEMQGLDAQMKQHHEKCSFSEGSCVEDDERNMSEHARSSGESLLNIQNSEDYPPSRSPLFSIVSELSATDRVSVTSRMSHSLSITPVTKRSKKKSPSSRNNHS